MSVIQYRILGERWAPDRADGHWYLAKEGTWGFSGWEGLGIVSPEKFIRSLGITPTDGPGWVGQCPWFACEADVRRIAAYLVALDMHRLRGLLEGV